MGGMGRRLDGHDGGGEDDGMAMIAMMCDAKSPLKCVEEQSVCAPMAKQMQMGADQKEQIDMTCKLIEFGCMDKMSGPAATCSSAGEALDKNDCDAKAAKGQEMGSCCTLLKAVTDCLGKDCMTVVVAMNEMEQASKNSGDMSNSQDMSDSPDDSEGSSTDFDAYQKSCPDGGVPTAAEITKMKEEASAAHSPDSSELSGSATTAAPAAKVVKVAFKVEGLEYDKMDAVTKTALTTSLTEMMANKFGVDKKYIEITLSSGSVKVDAKNKATEAGVDPSKIKKDVASISPAAIVETVKKVPNIEKAATGGSLDGISVSTPVATEETVDSSGAGAGEAAAGATSVQAMSAVFVVSTLAALM
jgi:hypothetical protein